MSSNPINAERMADIYEIRLRNLRFLIDEHVNGNLAQFVEWTLNGSMSYKALQNVTGPGRKRNLGSMLARRIEAHLQLVPGWMDHDHSGLIVQPGTIPNGRSERVMRLAESIASVPAPMREHVERIVEALASRRGNV
jgi:hypothetical protein